jgi:hypothetical protein
MGNNPREGSFNCFRINLSELQCHYLHSEKFHFDITQSIFSLDLLWHHKCDKLWRDQSILHWYYYRCKSDNFGVIQFWNFINFWNFCKSLSNIKKLALCYYTIIFIENVLTSVRFLFKPSVETFFRTWYHYLVNSTVQSTIDLEKKFILPLVLHVNFSSNGVFKFPIYKRTPSKSFF